MTRFRAAALAALHSLGPLAVNAIPALIAMLKQTGPPPPPTGLGNLTLEELLSRGGAEILRMGQKELLRDEAANTLADIGRPSIDPLIAALRPYNLGLATRVPQILARIGAPAVEPLIRAIEHRNPSVRAGVPRRSGSSARRRPIRSKPSTECYGGGLRTHVLPRPRWGRSVSPR